ncbi:MAG: hypothetical protein MPJ50_00150 [Pirellulales bacterium]|nr:hypothetical protein [Pirellulales bacterium]
MRWPGISEEWTARQQSASEVSAAKKRLRQQIDSLQAQLRLYEQIERLQKENAALRKAMESKK